MLSFILLTNNLSSKINNPAAINALAPNGAIRFFKGFPPNNIFLFLLFLLLSLLTDFVPTNDCCNNINSSDDPNVLTPKGANISDNDDVTGFPPFNSLLFVFF